MNNEYKNCYDQVSVLFMSLMTAKSNRKMINYVNIDLRKKMVFFPNIGL